MAQEPGAGGARPALARYPVDQAEIARLKPQYPHVVDLVERGEALAVAGDMTQALAMFKQAFDEYAYSGLVKRRQCEALTVLGRREEAVKACRDAMQYSPIPLNFRATVRALLAGTDPPSARDLAQAMQLGGIERRQRPDEPWGYAALCDVGERLGDEAMLQYCSENLLRMAPNDPTTRRVLAELHSPWWVGAGWLAIALSAVATLAHALWSAALRPRRRPERAAVVSLVLLAASFSATVARADDPSPASAEPAPSAQPAGPPSPRHNPDDLGTEWTVNDDSPDTNIPGEGARNRNPLEFGYWLQDVTARGVKASEEGDHEKAVKYFKALAKAVPDRAVSFGRLCAEYEALGKRDAALLACSAAITRSGVLLSDYERLVHLVLAKPDRLNEKEVATLAEVVQHVREDPNGGDLAAVPMECDIAVKLRDASKLQQCITALASVNPKDARTLTYEWALAMVRGQFDEAQKIIDRAKSTSMKPVGLEAMERETARDQSQHRKIQLLVVGGGALLVLGATLIVLAMRRRSPPLPTPASQAS